MKKAFTLAEVLITIGIVGIVAALTLPGLLQEYATIVVETKLKKFYSQINQAIQLSEAQYGDKKYWYSDANSVKTDSDGKPVAGSSTAEKWFNKYIGKHMTVIKISYDENARPTFYLEDGTALQLMNGGDRNDAMTDWAFYTSNPDKCIKQYGSRANATGKCRFSFLYMPGGENLNTTTSNSAKDGNFKYHIDKGFEPYKFGWNGNTEQLLDWCKNGKPQYCSAVIQMNNWKIPNDYPFKVSY